ncbi:hypothetical protein [Paenibacillus polymyxa]|uniref:hypothetical protein n=1 Tax=Paenibacillus polymyxa TaxID=1406 RepID=UPI002379142F|nr:hypothetical protein [Paenibacillus polymyxa]
MKTKKTVWIPAIIAVTVAALLVIYYYYTPSVSGGGLGLRPPGGEVSNVPGHMGGRPGEKGGGGNGELFKTLGTISVFLGAATWGSCLDTGKKCGKNDEACPGGAIIRQAAAIWP